MTIAVETYLVVAMAFAIFAAVVALGSSIVLGVGFERLRAGFEVIKSQTGFFSDAIHTLDKRTVSLEKQGQYFFETLHKLEEEKAKPVAAETDIVSEQEELLSDMKKVALINVEKPQVSNDVGLELWHSDAGDNQIRFN